MENGNNTQLSSFPCRPTICPMPNWIGTLGRVSNFANVNRMNTQNARVTLNLAISRLRFSNMSVRHLSKDYNLYDGLMNSPVFPDFPVVLNSGDLANHVEAIAPIDGTEIVEWMQNVTAQNAVIDARCLEYDRAGSQLIALADDPYIPGVVVEDCFYIPDLGRDVGSRGNGVIRTPRGDFNVPAGGRAIGIFKDLITWGGIDWVGYTQWTAALAKWRELAGTPIRDRIGFLNFNGITSPQYVVSQTSRRALVSDVRQVFTTDTPQRMDLVWRDPTDYTRVIHRDFVFLDEGTTELTYRTWSFPFVPPHVEEMTPSNGTLTVLDEFIVSP